MACVVSESAMFSSFQSAFPPVSYTHLDVYKRQELTQEELKQYFSEPIFGQIAETADTLGMYSFENEERIKQILQEQSIPYTDFKSEKMNLEDVFIGLTGKY